VYDLVGRSSKPGDLSDETLVANFHFFSHHLNDKVKVQKVDTKEQLADQFTKGLAQCQFEKWVANSWDREMTYEQQLLPSGHSSGIKFVQNRGSDAGQAQLSRHVTLMI